MEVNMALEVVTVPVADVDRAKRIYQSLGWRLDIDLVGLVHGRDQPGRRRLTLALSGDPVAPGGSPFQSTVRRLP
jgi:catechol 2,3-dioxygenase-like lactoylglutathione lyase family enzyme